MDDDDGQLYSLPLQRKLRVKPPLRRGVSSLFTHPEEIQEAALQVMLLPTALS